MINLSKFKGKSFYVVGLGISGRSCKNALEAAGANTYSWDDKPTSGVTLTPPSVVPFSELTALILSPGIPQDHRVAAMAKNAGIEIISDVELAFRAGIKAPAIGVTGTNGKSTVTALTAHVLNSLGKAVAIGGNFGPATLDMKDPGNDGFIVLELSSYQLELSPGYDLESACVLNVALDHLERHGTMEAYAATKARIFKNARHGYILGTDPWCKAMVHNTKGKMVPPSCWPSPSANPVLTGEHQRQNRAAVLAMLVDLGFNEIDILAAMESFTGIPHRQEVLGRTNKWIIINDSKATNPISAAVALKTYNNIHWLAGGQGKDGGYEELVPALGNIQKAYLYGQNAEELGIFCRDHNLPHQQFEDLKEATKAALSDPTGGTLLLSPAAASFDQYDNFMSRGDHFRSLVDESATTWNVS